MLPPPLWLMLVLVAVTYLATYGAGGWLSRLTGLRLPSAVERFGVSCALGGIVLGWVGYLAAVWRAPSLAVAVTWLCVAAVLALAIWSRRRPAPPTGAELTRWEWALIIGAVLVGLLFAAGMNYWQIQYHADGSMTARMVWPDLLYRNAVMSALLRFDGPPDWPWLAGVPMKGMSMLRYTTFTPVLRALGIPSAYYQIVALWLGLFGVPVAACTCLAFCRALGASAGVSSLAVLLTSFVGNPRWLLNERFAHSPALHWAGTDVFAISIPVLFTMLALVVLALRDRKAGVIALAVLALLSGTGHAPWLSLSLYTGLGLWFIVALIRRRDVGVSALLLAGALGGVIVLKLVMGTGTGHGSVLGSIGPSGLIRNLRWAFPFLSEPLRPLLSSLGPTNFFKLGKFVAVYLIAVLFYLGGSLWVRNVIFLDASRWRLDRLREAPYGMITCVAVAGVLLSSVVNFNKLAFQGAEYDVMRVLWPLLLVANIAVADMAVRHRQWLKTFWGIVVVLLFVFYGSWENVQLVQWSRTALLQSRVPAPQLAALRYLGAHGHPGEVLLIDPRYKPKPAGLPGVQTISHHWGYVSGLLDMRLYLDNEDMARKFGQRAVWLQRLKQVRRFLDTTDASRARDFLRQNRVRWVMLEGGEKPAAGLRAVGLHQVFAQGAVRVYEVELSGNQRRGP